MTEDGGRRRQTVALILSGVFPGLGQLYNRQPLKAVAFLAGGGVLAWRLARVAPPDLAALAAAGGTVLLLLLAFLGLALWSVIDAWRSAGYDMNP
jgi:hypothetical protein